MSDPTAASLQDLRDIRATGGHVKETSFYPALSNLLNEVRKRLKPKVRGVINLADRGAGLPDGGLLTSDQFQRASEAAPLPGQLPALAAIEVKGTGDDVHAIAAGEQVARYLGNHRLVLVTNEPGRRRRADQRRPEARGDGARLRRGPAGAVRHGSPPDRPALATPGRERALGTPGES
jgi:hypothetical protein